MEPTQEAVNQEESAPAVQPQQTDGQSEQVAAVEDGQQETSQAQGQAQIEAVDETGVPYKNRYMETQRKLAELSDNLPKIIEDTLAKRQNQPQPQQEYTVEQLEQIALQNPNLRPQVEAEKLKIYQRETAKQIEERDKKLESQRHAEVVRMRTEQEILNDPALKECFTTNALGQKQWRREHPLTAKIAEIMRNPELANRPDGLRVAADIAYGQYMREVVANTNGKAKAMQAAIKREQKKTLIEGGASTGSSAGGDEFTKARNELAKTGSKTAAQKAILAYMSKAGLGRQG